MLFILFCPNSIIDGDIPCTPETEPSFAYSFNYCANVHPVPPACDKMGKSGVALQYLDLGGSEYDCYVIGKYDALKDDLSYSLLDKNDPSKGVTMSYPFGERCELGGVMRSARIDVECADVAHQIVSAQSTTHCSYNLVVKSYYGCPTVPCSMFLFIFNCCPFCHFFLFCLST